MLGDHNRDLVVDFGGGEDGLRLELQRIFHTKTLAEWIPILSAQRGQWDVVKKVSELLRDPQAEANGFIQRIDYGEGR